MAVTKPRKQLPKPGKQSPGTRKQSSKLIIQIPCLNEEKTLPRVLKELPRRIPGIAKIEVVVIDDGSTDKTVEVARKHGATVLRHRRNRGLGMAFKTGQEYALAQGADILVNTDADNQYPGKYIEKLVKPVVEGTADFVIGNRQPWKVKHFSAFKRLMQAFGSWAVRRLTGTKVQDTVSGFRAYSREAITRLTVTTKFSYVLDTIMQAADKGLKIMSVPITTNRPTRRSRLFKNIFQHMAKSGGNLLRVYAIYKPFKTFLTLAFLFALPGLILGGRFIYLYIIGQGQGHVQSLIATAILLLTAVIMFVLGIIGEQLKHNRLMTEEVIRLLRVNGDNGAKGGNRNGDTGSSTGGGR